MKRFYISEEEKKHILGLHKKHMLTEQNANSSNVETTTTTLVPNLGGDQVTDKLGTRPIQPLTQPNTQPAEEKPMSQEERDKAFDKAQEEAWANQNQSQKSEGQPTYNTGVNFAQQSVTETGMGLGRLLTSDNTDSGLLNIIKSPDNPNSSQLIVPAPEVSAGDDKIVADYNKKVNDYLVQNRINLRLKWIPNQPNTQTSMKYGKFYLESSEVKPVQTAIAQNTQSGGQQAAQQGGVQNKRIDELQKLLNSKGFKVGAEDNKLGRNTWNGVINAVSSYVNKQNTANTTTTTTNKTT